jgi:hypothetical protein
MLVPGPWALLWKVRHLYLMRRGHAESEVNYYLNSYRPLVRNRFGREAYERFRHPPFVDGSCRREPDLESPFPSITAICRLDKFAPRLQVGDRVIYMTTKMGTQSTNRIVAALVVVKRFESHRAAAEWYKSMHLPLPSNCLVPGNLPLSIEHTDHGKPLTDDVHRWDLKYQLRARKCGVFLICRPLKIELHDPVEISRDNLLAIFGRVPATRNPPAIRQREFDGLAACFGKG